MSQAIRGMERMNRTKGTMNYRVSTMIRDAMDTVPTDQEAYEAELAAQGIPVVKSTGPSLEATGTFSGTFSDFQGGTLRLRKHALRGRHKLEYAPWYCLEPQYPLVPPPPDPQKR